jgi:hypothetical protein
MRPRKLIRNAPEPPQTNGQLGAEERAEVIEKQTRAFICPHCHTRLMGMVRVTICGVHEEREHEQFLQRAEAAGRDLLSDPKLLPTSEYLEIRQKSKEGDERVAAAAEQFRAFALELANSPVYEPFKTALEWGPGGIPKCGVAEYFIKFLRRATRLSTPQFAIRQCLPEEDRAGELELWRMNTVSAVISNGEFKTFLPSEMVDGNEAKRLQMTSGKVTTERVTLDIWVKTRWGYVQGKGALLAEMRNRYLGQFAL